METEVILILGAESGLANAPIVLAGTTALAVGGIAYGLAQWVADLRSRRTQRIDRRLRDSSSVIEPKLSAQSARASVLKKNGGNGQHQGWIGRVAGAKPVDKLQRILVQADLSWNAARLVVLLALLSTAVMVAGVLLGVGLIGAIFLGMPVVLGPAWYVNRKRKRRIQTLLEQLPDAFDVIGQALRVGQSLATTIGAAAEQIADPLAHEFALVYQEQNMGVPLEEALTNLRNRVDQMDVSFFVSAVQTQRRSGGNLAEVLDNIGEIIRDRTKLKGHIACLTAEGRLSGWLLLALPPVMLIVEFLMNPGYVSKLFVDEMGRMMLMGAAGMQLLGLLMIRKIVNIKL